MSDDSGGPDWIVRLSFPTERRDLEDRVERVLFLSGSTGSTIDEEGGRTVVRLYFATPGLRDDAVAMFPEDLSELAIETEEADKVDWLEFYEHSLEPIEIGNRWIVAPHERLVPDPTERIPLVIPQERAFGTGSHESTAMCLAMMERLALAGKRVLDIGTGSGILAIAAEKLDARQIVAFDIDPDAAEVVRGNCRRNAVDEARIAFFLGDINALDDRAPFDLVMMNIIPEVILPALPTVVRHVGRDGSVVFSGILKERSAMVIDRASDCHLRLIDHLERGEWWCGRFARS